MRTRSKASFACARQRTNPRPMRPNPLIPTRTFAMPRTLDHRSVVCQRQTQSDVRDSGTLQNETRVGSTRGPLRHAALTSIAIASSDVLLVVARDLVRHFGDELGR